MPMSHDLSRDDCSRLLRAGVAGRVALGTPDGPHIIPVNYAVDAGEHGNERESVLVRTTAYSLLGTYGRGCHDRAIRARSSWSSTNDARPRTTTLQPRLSSWSNWSTSKQTWASRP